jgi:hypothetical protein
MNAETENHSGIPSPFDLLATSIALTSTQRMRNGKVARLPAAIRDVVNEMLHDSRYYRQIVARLTELGYPGIRPQNLSEWYKGGYQDWLRSKAELEDLRHDQALSIEMARDPNAASNLAKANELLLTLRLNRLLTDSNPGNLGDTLRFMRLARFIARQMREANRRNQPQFEPRA